MENDHQAQFHLFLNDDVVKNEVIRLVCLVEEKTKKKVQGEVFTFKALEEFARNDLKEYMHDEAIQSLEKQSIKVNKALKEIGSKDIKKHLIRIIKSSANASIHILASHIHEMNIDRIVRRVFVDGMEPFLTNFNFNSTSLVKCTDSENDSTQAEFIKLLTSSLVMPLPESLEEHFTKFLPSQSDQAQDGPISHESAALLTIEENMEFMVLLTSSIFDRIDELFGFSEYADAYSDNKIEWIKDIKSKTVNATLQSTKNRLGIKCDPECKVLFQTPPFSRIEMNKEIADKTLFYGGEPCLFNAKDEFGTFIDNELLLNLGLLFVLGDPVVPPNEYNTHIELTTKLLEELSLSENKEIISAQGLVVDAKTRLKNYSLIKQQLRKLSEFFDGLQSFKENSSNLLYIIYTLYEYLVFDNLKGLRELGETEQLYARPSMNVTNRCFFFTLINYLTPKSCNAIDLLDDVETIFEELLIKRRCDIDGITDDNYQDAYVEKVYGNYRFRDEYFAITQDLPDDDHFSNVQDKKMKTTPPPKPGFFTRILNTLGFARTILDGYEKRYPGVFYKDCPINISDDGRTKICKYDITDVETKEKRVKSNTVASLFNPGFTSELDNMSNYLKVFCKDRNNAEVFGVNWKASDLKELIKSFIEPKDFSLEKLEEAANDCFKNLKHKAEFLVEFSHDITQCLLDHTYLKAFGKLAELAISVILGFEKGEFSWTTIAAKLFTFLVSGVTRVIAVFWLCYDEAIRVGVAQAYMKNKLSSFDNKPIDIYGFSLGTLAAFYTAVHIDQDSDKLGDIYLMGSVLDKDEFLAKIWNLIGEKGTIKGRLFIDYSTSDWVLWSLRYLKLIKEKQLEQPIGHWGISHEEILNYLLKQKLVNNEDYGTWLFYLQQKIVIVDVSDLKLGHTKYEKEYDKVLIRYYYVLIEGFQMQCANNLLIKLT